jgi:outer membrane lipoprotein carrier protein
MWTRSGSLWLALLAPLAAQSDLFKLLDAVEQRYNSPRTIRLLFDQIYTMPGRPPRTEAGELFLRRPARMRWQYRDPAGKLFLVDGKHVYFYTPSNNTVEKSRLKESDDLRAPLAFLIGRLDFQRDFREFRHRAEGADTVVAARPRSDNAPYEQVDFIITPERRIRRLVITGQDRSVMEFRFSKEQLNPAVADTLFVFQTPPGAELIEITGPAASPSESPARR